jgi:anaerobic ribonucleoside-triphosphate reductase activating protein
MSTVDEIGKISTSIFVGGCNFDCPFCQNYDLIKRNEYVAGKSVELVKTIRGDSMIDCVVVSGGEPTIHGEMYEFVKELHEAGKPVFLNTNGYLFATVEKIAPLLAGVSMDIKTSFRRYSGASGVSNINCERIREIVTKLAGMNREGFKVEFRTTMVDPYAVKDDVMEIASFLSSIEFSGYYALQQLDLGSVRDRLRRRMHVISADEMLSIAQEISGSTFKVFARTMDRGVVKFF